MPNDVREHRATRAALLITAASIFAAAACHAGPAAPDTGPNSDTASTPGSIPATVLAAAAATITSGGMAAHIGVIAADSMKGRDTPSPGLEASAAYMTAVLADAGVQAAGDDGYLERFDYDYPELDPSSVVLEPAGGGTTLVNGRDYFMVGATIGDATGSILWGGSAETSANAGGLDMAAKVVMYDLPISRFGVAASLLTIDVDRETEEGGAAAVGFVVSPDFPESEMATAVRITRRWSRTRPGFWIREPSARTLLSAAGADLDSLRAEGPRIRDGQLHVGGHVVTQHSTPPNVVGVLPGSDSTLRDQYVVVSAHLDHLGVDAPDENGDAIYNGADDNASGSAAVVEIARALASLPTAPARSVLFILFSAEEKGLVGSSHFMASGLVAPSAMVAEINLDMIGRNDRGSVIGVGREFTTIGDTVVGLAQNHGSLGLTVIDDPKPEEHLFNRSDHVEFACRDIPSILITSGLHEDYHRANDEVARLDTDKAARVARLVFYLVASVANAAGPPVWTSVGTAELEELRGACP